ncbi:hypothetical protein QFC22_005396 [Naganishia vaughanmartiniae]|uniref:Uncharacterized protein n=1 Tax=Naganishia vaughanmartiniae TaxID=1424756 RepID=A0ACC2WUF8_9TREE|nr:hypothetical protein QFC22_005396 [Naganishia vaughanmartiniae]
MPNMTQPYGTKAKTALPSAPVPKPPASFLSRARQLLDMESTFQDDAPPDGFFDDPDYTIVSSQHFYLRTPIKRSEPQQKPSVPNRTSVAHELSHAAASPSLPSSTDSHSSGPSRTHRSSGGDHPLLKDGARRAGRSRKQHEATSISEPSYSPPAKNDTSAAPQSSLSPVTLDLSRILESTMTQFSQSQLIGPYLSVFGGDLQSENIQNLSGLQDDETSSAGHSYSPALKNAPPTVPSSSASAVRMESSRFPQPAVAGSSHERQLPGSHQSDLRDDTGSDISVDSEGDEEKVTVGVDHTTILDNDDLWESSGSRHGDTEDAALSTDCSNSPHSHLSRRMDDVSTVAAAIGSCINALAFEDHLLNVESSVEKRDAQADTFGEWVISHDDGNNITGHLDSSPPITRSHLPQPKAVTSVERESSVKNISAATGTLASQRIIRKWQTHDDETDPVGNSRSPSPIERPLSSPTALLDPERSIVAKWHATQDDGIDSSGKSRSSVPIEDSHTELQHSLPPTASVALESPLTETSHDTALKDQLVLDLLRALIRAVKEQFQA